MYLRSILKYESKYDEQLMMDLLGRKNDGLSAYINGINTESELLEMLAERLQVSEEEIPAAYMEQLYLLFQIAQNENIIVYNPLSEKMYETTPIGDNFSIISIHFIKISFRSLNAFTTRTFFSPTRIMAKPRIIAITMT